MGTTARSLTQGTQAGTHIVFYYLRYNYIVPDENLSKWLTFLVMQFYKLHKYKACCSIM